MSPFFRRRRTQKKSKKEKINIKKVVHYIPDSGVQYKPESIVHYIPEYSHFPNSFNTFSDFSNLSLNLCLDVKFSFLSLAGYSGAS